MTPLCGSACFHDSSHSSWLSCIAGHTRPSGDIGHRGFAHSHERASPPSHTRPEPGDGFVHDGWCKPLAEARVLPRPRRGASSLPCGMGCRSAQPGERRNTCQAHWNLPWVRTAIVPEKPSGCHKEERGTKVLWDGRIRKSRPEETENGFLSAFLSVICGGAWALARKR